MSIGIRFSNTAEASRHCPTCQQAKGKEHPAQQQDWGSHCWGWGTGWRWQRLATRWGWRGWARGLGWATRCCWAQGCCQATTPIATSCEYNIWHGTAAAELVGELGTGDNHYYFEGSHLSSAEEQLPPYERRGIKKRGKGCNALTWPSGNFMQ